MLSRFGGDEFTVLLDDSPHNENHELVAGKLLNALIKPFNLEGKNVYIRASIGIYQAKTDTDTTESLIQKADIAMYQAKSQGKGCYRYYDYSLNTQTQHKVMLTSALHQAIEQNQLHLNYQVQVNAASGNPVSMEALLRWTHPDWGEVPPSEFIPLAETCGLIIPIGEWVLQAVCSQVALWQTQGLQAIPVAINVSVDQFYDEHLAERIKSMIKESRLAPELIEIEITESAAMNNPEKTVAQLEALKAIGITIAIDDFGTGYSSLSYLKKLPVSKLKVDREFVKDIVTDADNRAITNAVISLAHTMNLKVVAEGVETEQVRSLLIDMGCDLVQGFLFSRPVPAEQIPSALRSLKARSKRANKNNTGPEPRWCSKHCEKVAL
jgi:predicted signal transduction protein with EAL and GGDEF domain